MSRARRAGRTSHRSSESAELIAPVWQQDGYAVNWRQRWTQPLLAERDQERIRADCLRAVGDERQKVVDAMKEELVQVRKDKDAEIARLITSKLAGG